MSIAIGGFSAAFLKIASRVACDRLDVDQRIGRVGRAPERLGLCQWLGYGGFVIDRLAADMSVEQRLIGRIAGTDWSIGANRHWPAEWFVDLDHKALHHWAWQYKLRPMTAMALRAAGWPDVDASQRAAYEEAERRCIVRAIEQLRLLREISRRAAQQGLDLIVLKGVCLSVQLYGDPLIREAHDLDLLVDPQSADRLDRLLRDLGCEAPAIPAHLTERQRSVRARFTHEEKFFHPASGITIERHDKLSANTAIVEADFASLWQRRGTVAIGDFTVSTLGDADLPYYLGVHAARHGWERWKWAADLAMLLGRADATQLEALRATARRMGTTSLLHSWILLIEAIAAGMPAALVEEAGTDRHGVRLADMALAISTARQSRETIQAAGNALRPTLYRLLLKRRPRYVAIELGRLFYREKDWRDWNMPDVMIPFLFVRRPVAYLFRKIGNAARASNGRGEA